MPDNKKKPKLHELVAIRPGARSQAEKCRKDLVETFEKKRHHFQGATRTFKPLAEDGVEKVEEKVDLQTTVRKELAWITPYLAKAVDSLHRVNVGNTISRADLVLENEETLLANLPGTTLLELEDFVDELRRFADKIPTLDPVKGFRPDPNQSAGIFIARESQKVRSQKKNVVILLHPPTDKHPAQTQLAVEDVPVGTIQEIEWSGMLTIQQKGEILDRVDELARCIKRARSRANDLEVDLPPKIGEKLVDYAFAGLNSAVGAI